MTDHEDTRPDWDSAHALSGAYAVDALDDLERARFEAHLRGCPDCRIEVETFRETAAALAVDPIEPPARLRAEVLAGIESIRPLPPLIEHRPRGRSPTVGPPPAVVVDDRTAPRRGGAGARRAGDHRGAAAVGVRRRRG